MFFRVQDFVEFLDPQVLQGNLLSVFALVRTVSFFDYVVCLSLAYSTKCIAIYGLRVSFSTF
jgi:hypothetical protein